MEIPTLRKPLSLASDVLAWRELRCVLFQMRPGIVHTHLAKAGVLGRLAARRLRRNGATVLHTVHGPTFDGSLPAHKRWVYKSAERAAARCTDGLIFVGDELQESFDEQRIVPAGFRAVIRTGRPELDDDRFDTAFASKAVFGGPGPESRRRLICLGRLVSVKQQTHVIRLLQRLREAGHDVELELAGEALVESERRYEMRLRTLTEALNLSPYVHFSGHVEDAPMRLARADLSVLTSSYEGLPNVAVESLLSGTPMVGYAVSGIREVFGEELAGLVVPKDNTDALFDTTVDALTRFDELASLVAMRRKHLKSEYRMSRMLSAKLALYKNLKRDPAVNGVTVS